MKREIYEKLGGFDEKIFMYAEDVDLSWRLRSFGYKIRYVPKSVIMHYSYEEAGEIKPNQHVYGVINNMMLRYRFGGLKDILKGHLKFWFLMVTPEAFPGSKKCFAGSTGAILGICISIPEKHGEKDVAFQPEFLNWDYSINREGGFYFNEFPKETPKVSIIVRTCGRPSVLRETLVSLRNRRTLI